MWVVPQQPLIELWAQAGGTFMSMAAVASACLADCVPCLPCGCRVDYYIAANQRIGSLNVKKLPPGAPPGTRPEVTLKANPELINLLPPDERDKALIWYRVMFSSAKGGPGLRVFSTDADGCTDVKLDGYVNNLGRLIPRKTLSYRRRLEERTRKATHDIHRQVDPKRRCAPSAAAAMPAVAHPCACVVWCGVVQENKTQGRCACAHANWVPWVQD